MEILKIVITILFVIDCIALSAVVLMQEGKSAGLGTIAGMADTYWGQNRGRSIEGTLVKVTKVPCGTVSYPCCSTEFKSICLVKEDAEHSISKNRVFFFYDIR